MTNELEATVRELAAREAIRQVFYTYVDRIDAGDIAAVEALFTVDATYDFMGNERQGRENIARRLRRALSDFDRTSHHVSNALIEVAGEAASLSAGLYAYHLRKVGTEPWHFWGRYTQDLVRIDGQWRIARMALIGIDGSPMTDDERALFPGRPDRQRIEKDQ